MTDVTSTFETEWEAYEPAKRLPFVVTRLRNAPFVDVDGKPRDPRSFLMIHIIRPDMKTSKGKRMPIDSFSVTDKEMVRLRARPPIADHIESEIDAAIEEMCNFAGLDFVSRTGEVVKLETVYHG